MAGSVHEHRGGGGVELKLVLKANQVSFCFCKILSPQKIQTYLQVSPNKISLAEKPLMNQSVVEKAWITGVFCRNQQGLSTLIVLCKQLGHQKKPSAGLHISFCYLLKETQNLQSNL